MPSDSVVFFVGLHQLADAQHFERCMISVNRTERRVSDFAVGEWIMDSGAFTEVSKHGEHRRSVADYAAQIRRWSRCGTLLAAVTQDWMCEPHIIAKTGLTVEEHQRRSLDRYERLREADTAGTYVMPVVQGYSLGAYRRHARAIARRTEPGAWIGVGSVCKRNKHPAAVAAILSVIREELPGARLHGFGLKKTALAYPPVRRLLYSSDSMAWSFAARRAGRDANSWREAERYCRRLREPDTDAPLFATAA